MFVGKRGTIFTEYTENIIFPRIFWERSSFTFRLEKISYFREKEMPSFLMVRESSCSGMIFFRKAIFSEHLKKISCFHVFSWERSSFIFRLKNKIIFSGKKNTIFPDGTRSIISQCDSNHIPVRWKTIFSEHLEKENMVFRAVYFVFILSFISVTCSWNMLQFDLKKCCS